MKVILINGSPNARGCTYTALQEVEKILNAESIDTEIIQIGHKDIRGCIGCRQCKKIGKCIFDDCVNLFYSSQCDKTMKVGAAVVSARRGGCSATFDELNKYFTISSMPVVSSQYWNSVHGYTAEDVRKDAEGLQTMRVLGKNMAFLIKSIQLGKEKYGLPEKEKSVHTHFIR